MAAGLPSLVMNPVPLKVPWPVKEGCSFVGCHVQCSMSALVTWTKEKELPSCQGCCRM